VGGAVAGYQVAVATGGTPLKKSRGSKAGGLLRRMGLFIKQGHPATRINFYGRSVNTPFRVSPLTVARAFGEIGGL